MRKHELASTGYKHKKENNGFSNAYECQRLRPTTNWVPTSSEIKTFARKYVEGKFTDVLTMFEYVYSLDILLSEKQANCLFESICAHPLAKGVRHVSSHNNITLDPHKG